MPFVIDEIPDPGSRSFCIDQNTTHLLDGFVVRIGQHAYAYRNACPHTGATLNWSEGVFLDCNEELIQCAMHGALFSIEEEHCIWGPCRGDSLEKLALVVEPGGAELLIEL